MWNIFPAPKAVTDGEEEKLKAFRQEHDSFHRKAFDFVVNTERESSKGGAYAPRNL